MLRSWKRPLAWSGSFSSSLFPLGIPTDGFRVRGLGVNYVWDNNTTIDVTYANLGLSGGALAGESILTNANPNFTSHGLWAGSDLNVKVEAQLLQVAYNKAF